VEKAIAAAREFVGDRDVERPFFATGALRTPLLFENPSAVVQGDRVTHLVYDVSR
jgi:hypothetical protein